MNNNFLSLMEVNLLNLASKLPTEIPSGRQSPKILEMLFKLQEEGFNIEIPIKE